MSEPQKERLNDLYVCLVCENCQIAFPEKPIDLPSHCPYCKSPLKVWRKAK